MSNFLHLSEAALGFRPGLYRHYKGGLYRALMVARREEDPSEELVVYQAQLDGTTWVRPLGQFLESVEVDGQSKLRFERVGE